MTIVRIFTIHLVALCFIVALNMIFQEQSAAIAALVQPATVSLSQEPALGLRILLYGAANIVLLALAPILWRCGLFGVDSERICRQCSWPGLIGTNFCLCVIWVGIFFVPLPPPKWANHAAFYVFLTVGAGTAMQLLLQVNAYKFKLTNST